MKVALPIRNGRISPVFDVAIRLIVVDIEDDAPSVRSEFAIRESGGEARAVLLQELGVSKLICGAISNETARIIERCGIEIKPWIIGEIEDVINAFCTGSLDSDGFIMPGCGRGQVGGRINRQRRRSGCRVDNRGKAGPGNRRSGGGRRKI